jgi:tetratricopeptide (TPR) repeat protein
MGETAGNDAKTPTTIPLAPLNLPHNPLPGTQRGSSIRSFLGVIRLKPIRTLTALGMVLLIALAAGVLSAFAWFDYQLRGARRAVNLGHNAEAVTHLEVCRRYSPDHAEVLILSSRVARRTGAWSEADALLDRYSELYGDNDSLALERLLLRATRGEIAVTGALLQYRIDQQDANSPLAREALIAGLLYRFQLDDAQRQIEQWVEREPGSAVALLARGKFNEERGHSSEAALSYRRLLEFDPHHHEARMRLCAILLQLSQGEEALAHAQYLYKHLPHHAGVLVQLAQALDLQGRGDEARSTLDECLRRFPDHPAALAERGRIANRDGDSRRAEELLRLATRLDPGDARARYQLYLALNQNDKKDEAQKELAAQKAIVADVERIEELLFGRLKQSPNDPAAYHEVAMIALRSGRAKEALRWLQNALQVDPNYVPAHRTLAAYYHETGNPILSARHRAIAQQLSGEAAPGKER